jgi:hypothetical protein
MGNKVGIEPFMSERVAPQYYFDRNRAGFVYLVIHRSSTKGMASESLKNNHSRLAIDVAGNLQLDILVSVDDSFPCIEGSSNESQLNATHYDLCLDSPTDHSTYVARAFKERPWEHYQVVKQVGQFPINRLYQFFNPSYFADDIRHQLVQQVHLPMAIQNKRSTKWSSRLNCQTFTRAAIEFLNFPFPSDIIITSDCVPSLVDVYLAGRYITAVMTDEIT